MEFFSTDAVLRIVKQPVTIERKIMAQFPDKSNVVIIGLGGIVGASVMHHLVERGWEDIVGIDKTSVPTDIGSTSHASDFCYATDHSKFVCYTTGYSIEFFDKMGHYSRIGGLEDARKGDDDRMMELKRKVASGKAFGTNVKMINAAEAKALFPLLEEDMMQCNPDWFLHRQYGRPECRGRSLPYWQRIVLCRF